MAFRTNETGRYLVLMTNPPAIGALNSGVSLEMHMYEDMLDNEAFLDSFWNSIISMG